MSTMEEQLATTPTPTALVAPKRPAPKARIKLDDAVPRREVEVVSPEEIRREAQIQRKAKKPTASFTSSSAVSSRQIAGVEVDSEVLFGFLAASTKVVPSDKTLPILNSVKLSYEAGGDRMFIEAASSSLWTAVAVKTATCGVVGFEVMAPARMASSAVNAVRGSFPQVPVGLSDGGFWIGPHRMPAGGKVEDFPGRPVMRAWEARAVVPAFYFDEICTRVLAVASKDPTKPALSGVLLDFALDDQRALSCTAVASDGARMHVLELSRMKIQPQGRATPPSIVVGEQFFRYLRTVANREWTALELNEGQVSGHGADYQAIALATVKGAASGVGLEKWRTIQADHPGDWMVDRKEIERILKKIDELTAAERIDLRINAMHEQLDVWFENDEGRKIHESIGARRVQGPSIVDVPINRHFLAGAIQACRGGLIRLSFASGKSQPISPVTIRGEDDQFKAVVMPINGESA